MNTAPLRRSVALAALALITRSHALGVDKLLAELDTTKDFHGVASFTVFNDDSAEQVFVTAQGLRWDMTPEDPMKMSPTHDLAIFPPVQRIAAGGTATFRIRYAGPPITVESCYRILFRSVRIPASAAGKASAPLTVEDVKSSALVGLSMTVPVYVADQSTAAAVLDKIQARYKPDGNALDLTVEDGGSRHVTIQAYRIDGQEHARALGVVQGGHSRRFKVDAAPPASQLEIQVADHDRSAWITVTRAM